MTKPKKPVSIKPVELSKKEALLLINLHIAANEAVRKRDEFAKSLYVKYRIDPKKLGLNIAEGAFVPAEEK